MAPRLPSSADRDLGSEKARRDREGIPDRPWHEEPTALHGDGQTFRALKGLREELLQDLEANKVEAARAHGALKAEVVALASTVERQGEKLDDVTTTAARMEGKLDVMLADRRPASSSSQQRVVETLLGDKLNEQQHRRERSTTLLKGIVSFFTSPPIIVALAAAGALLIRGCL